MEARPAPILEFFNGTKQLLVPLFQRPYEWGDKEWETLWSDILEQYERNDEEAVALHFTGAIVTAPARSIPVGVSKYLVIDGQQRLTTVAVLLCAVRSLFEPSTPRYRKITRLLVNEDDDGLDFYKLMPTQPDRAGFQSMIRNSNAPDTRFDQAFNFFKKKISGTDSDGVSIDIDRLIETIQNRLTVVAIHLGDTDDPYLIFESLNAKGTPLNQADLIRNYLLLRLPSSEQQRTYEEAWLPMQYRLKGDHLTEFMRQFLMTEGEEVSKSTIYSALKKRLSSPAANIAAEMHRMNRASMHYAAIVGLESSNEKAIERGLRRLLRWEVATANPLILKLLQAHESGITTAGDVASCLALIESFVVRRAICAVPTNQLKRIFLSLAKDISLSSPVTWMTERLREGSSGRRWPKDEELNDGLLRYRAYAPPVDRCKFILESIEESHEHKESPNFSLATIEHIMPQTLNSGWREALGTDFLGIHEQWIDLLGNLTLSAYNGQLSNLPFGDKKDILRNSNFEMNKWIAAQSVWTSNELAARTAVLFQAINKIWPRPGD